MSPFTYRGPKTSQISFPLGGIGSGSIGLAGNGRLIDWEIYNRPNKGSVNGFSHFAVRAENDDGVLAARILHSDLLPPYQGEITGAHLQLLRLGSAPRIPDRPAPLPDLDFHRRVPYRPARLRRRRLPGAMSRCRPSTPSSPPMTRTRASPPPSSRSA